MNVIRILGAITIIALLAGGSLGAGTASGDDMSPSIPAVSAGGMHTAGLKSDGTVVAVGNNYYGQCDVGSWSDIQQVSAGSYHTVGLKSDGKVVAVGWNVHGQCNVYDWCLAICGDVNDDGKVNMADVMILWYDIADYPSPGAWEVNCCEL